MSCPQCGGTVQRLAGDDVSRVVSVAVIDGWYTRESRVPAIVYACTACEWAQIGKAKGK